MQTFPKSLKILLGIVLTYLILVYGKPFLVPLVFAALFSMLLYPVCKRLERWGVNKGLAVVISLFSLIALVVGIVWILAVQISDIRNNSSSIEQNITKRINEVQKFVSQKLGVSQQKQQEIIEKQQQSSSNRISSFITGSVKHLGSALTDILLVVVYMFLFLFFRRHLQDFVLMVVPDREEGKTRQVISDARKVAQKYLTGLALMIVSLWIMYSIGFSIVGVKNPIFFAVLCGLLEIVPFVGNLAGTAITLLFALAQGGSTNLLLGIIVTYGTVQFIQSYFIEPLVVGREVSIHPLFTIVGIVAGEFIWGIPGMVLALPALGVIKIVCDHVPSLQPFGYLIGEEKKEGDQGLIDKIKGFFKKKH
jgi:predicted PurR-regulated permease PerM